MEWHGTPDEAAALTEAISHNCDCTFGIMGVRLSTCKAHDAFTHDQKWCDNLVFLRRYYVVHPSKKEEM